MSPLRILILSIIALVCAYIFFDEPFKRDDHSGFDVQNAFNSGMCDEEAVLIRETAEVFETPASKPFIKLSSGSIIYLCGVTGQFQRIVFPAAEERADCSVRKNTFCSSGFLRVPFEFEILG